MERMGQEVLSVQQLTHGYQDRTLFKNCNFDMEKSERVALIGEANSFVRQLHETLRCSVNCNADATNVSLPAGSHAVVSMARPLDHWANKAQVGDFLHM